MSDPVKTLRIAIASEWLLVGIGTLVHFFARSTLPPELTAYQNQTDSAPLTRLDIIYFAIGAPAFGLGFIASVGLWFLRKWARPLYAIATATLCLLNLCDQPTVQTALE